MFPSPKEEEFLQKMIFPYDQRYYTCWRGVRLVKKRKRKSAYTFGGTIKYEIYGIVLITLSMISLSGEATVGRSLAKMFALILGKFYFIIPLVIIYFSVYVMIHRKWPEQWTMRTSGLLLFILALTLMSTSLAMDQKLAPLGIVQPGIIISQVHHDMHAELLNPAPDRSYAILNKDISGGYLGAFQFALVVALFGTISAKLIILVMFIISFMLMASISYVDVIRMFKHKFFELFQSLHVKLQLRVWSERFSKTTISNGPAIKRRRSVQTDPIFDQNILITDQQDGDGADVAQMYAVDDALQQTTLPSPVIRNFFEQVTAREKNTVDTLSDEHDVHKALQLSPSDGLSGHRIDNAMTLPVVSEQQNGDHALINNEDLSLSVSFKQYVLPPFSLLSNASSMKQSRGKSAYVNTARKLEATLDSFGVKAKVMEVIHGPAVTRYEIQPDIGVKVSRIVSLTDDIALSLAAKDIRMEAPIPGKAAIGIEVPNAEVAIVTMREVMETGVFRKSQAKLCIAFGRDVSGQTIIGNLATMPHLLVAGATGSGKSVCINGIITSILYKATPNEVKFVMVDPKMVELNVYNGIPHLMAPVVTDPKRASLALKKIVVEMEKRYVLFAKSGMRNIEGYNSLMQEQSSEKLPYIVVIVDELADLMMVAAGEVEDAIARLAQMARAAGIHLIIATQRPSVDVITGVIKANIPSRIAFGVSSQVDSRTILDMGGAEKLLGRGDMLFMPMGASKPIRVQGAFMSDQEVETIVNYVRSQGEAQYDHTLVPEIKDISPPSMNMQDELYEQAVVIVLEAKQASASLLQRKMRIGYARAARLIDAIESNGIIGPYEGSKPREVRMSLEQYEQSKETS